ncbi:helix-turn-helix domain-containing protein [Helcobacillus sp. ACRRO]|uniref:helix-turn-helix domain-containing protein n=1 Tax=Helcobacillus sp. ACRRO TaxID=2918202 RepID=UPI001EF6F685|nr:helix-turn-helix transcriptional regulator [Helcobacillus sp. ACRRO]MCG7426025.1 helix-turn-helix domain-containing protein [Helcobacillus sp. ACRRO]
MARIDELIGMELSEMRKGRMSQAELAARMKDYGHKWSQSTVWSVEQGKRPLRAGEAVDAVGILGTDIRRFQARVQQGPWPLVRELGLRVQEAEARAVEALAQWRVAAQAVRDADVSVQEDELPLLADDEIELLKDFEQYRQWSVDESLHVLINRSRLRVTKDGRELRPTPGVRQINSLEEFEALGREDG